MPDSAPRGRGKKVLHKLRIRTGGKPEVGSREWYWDLRIQNAPMFAVPLLTLLFAAAVQDLDAPWGVLVMTVGPWVLVSFTLVLAMYSLWRVEVNVAKNRDHPFTGKDRKFLQITQGVIAGGMVLLLAMNLFVSPEHATASQQAAINGSTQGATILLLVSGVLVATMYRIHGKGKHAYDELGKGV